MTQAQIMNGDLLGHSIVWTPPIQELEQSFTAWLKLDMPGGLVKGETSVGKTAAISYVLSGLAGSVRHHYAVDRIVAPRTNGNQANFLGELLRQTTPQAVFSRNIPNMRQRLLYSLERHAESQDTKRLLWVIDDAQNMAEEDMAEILHLFACLAANKFRPCVLFVGNVDLRTLSRSTRAGFTRRGWEKFLSREHTVRGISADDVFDVLNEFDNAIAQMPSPALRTALLELAGPDWSLTVLAAPISRAMEQVAAKHDLAGGFWLGMENFRAVLIGILENVLERRIELRATPPHVILGYIKLSGALDVLADKILRKSIPTNAKSRRLGGGHA